MTKFGVILAAIVSALVMGCAASDDQGADTGSFSGEASFQTRCAVCHGEVADGTAAGPPLVHRLYEIGHHPNFSFHNAVNNGVTAHHWNFGNMPAIPNVPTEEVDAIVCHVRDLQRDAGIDAGEPC